MLVRICDPHVMSISPLLEPSFTTIRGRKWAATGIQWIVCTYFKSVKMHQARHLVPCSVDVSAESIFLKCDEKYVFLQMFFCPEDPAEKGKLFPKDKIWEENSVWIASKKRHRQSLYINSNSVEESIKFSSQLWDVPFLFVCLSVF